MFIIVIIGSHTETVFALQEGTQQSYCSFNFFSFGHLIFQANYRHLIYVSPLLYILWLLAEMVLINEHLTKDLHNKDYACSFGKTPVI